MAFRPLTEDELQQSGLVNENPPEQEQGGTLKPLSPKQVEALKLLTPGSPAYNLAEQYKEAWGLDADSFGKRAQLKDDTDLPDFVLDRRPQTEKKAQKELDLKHAPKIDWEEVERDYPVTGNFLGAHMPVAYDDIDNLKQQESLWKSLKGSFTRGVDIGKQGRLATRQMYGDSSADIEADIRALQASITGVNEYDSRLKGDVQKPDLMHRVLMGASEMMGQQSETFRGMSLYGTLGLIGGTIAALAEPSPFGEAVMAPIWARFAGKAGATAFGAVYGGAKSAFNMEAGNAWLEYKDVPGMDPDAARVAATLVGIVNAGVEMGQVSALLSPFKGVLAKMGVRGAEANRLAMKQLLQRPGVMDAFKGFAKNYGSVYLTNVSEEVLQQLNTQAGGVLGASLSGLGDKFPELGQLAETLLAEAQGAAESFALLPVPGAVGNFAYDVARAERATRNAQLFQALGDTAVASKVRNRLPKAFREFVDRATREGGWEKVYVSAGAFDGVFGQDAVKVAEDLGVKDEYEQAKATGGEIAIDTATYAEKLAPTPAHRGLVGELRLKEGEMTPNEAQAFLENVQAERDDAVREAQEAIAKGDEWGQEVERVRQEVRDQLVLNGRVDEEADADALVYASWVNSLAQKVKKTPLELHSSIGLRVQEGSEQGGQPRDGNTRKPPSEFIVKTEDAGEIQARVIHRDDGSIGILVTSDKGATMMDYNADFANGKSDKDIVAYALEGFGIPEIVEPNEGGSAEGLVLNQPDVETPEFKAWFGDSKVVDEQGKPLVVYRGESGYNREFTEFDRDKTNENAFFFTPDPNIAGVYATKGGKPRAFYLKAENLLDLSRMDQNSERFVRDWAQKWDDWVDRETGEEADPVEVVESGRLFDWEGDWSGRRWKDLQSSIEAAGYDGAILPDYDNREGIFPSYVAFSPTQIKSIDNEGTFDPNNPNIYKQGGRGQDGLGLNQADVETERATEGSIPVAPPRQVQMQIRPASRQGVYINDILSNARSQVDVSANLLSYPDLKTAVEGGLVTPETAILVDSLLAMFPEAAGQHFSVRVDRGSEGSSLHTMHKMGDGFTDAMHITTLFKNGSVLDVVDGFGRLVHDRLLSAADARVVKRVYRESGGAKQFGDDRAGWFATQFREWWLQNVEKDKGMTGIFRKAIRALKGALSKFHGTDALHPDIERLLNDIVTEGRDLQGKVYFSDIEFIEDYIIGREADPDLVKSGGFSDNSKTGMSYDPGNLCPKKLGFIEYMLRRLEKEGREVSALADPELNLMSTYYDDALDAGIPVPCRYCYVEQARREALVRHMEGKKASGVRFSMAKKATKRVPYLRQIRRWSDEKIAYINKRGGLRLFSFSDYIREEHFEDIKNILADAKSKLLSIKAITKVIAFVEDWASSGINIDVSIDAMNQAFGMDWGTAARFAEMYPNVHVRSVARNMDEVDRFAKLKYRVRADGNIEFLDVWGTREADHTPQSGLPTERVMTDEEYQARLAEGGWKNFVDVITPFHNDDAKSGVPDGYRDMGYKDNDLMDKVEKEGLSERMCCLNAGKCFDEKTCTQCPCNCGMLAGNLSIPKGIRETYQQSARGQIALSSGKNVISLFKSADASTFVHEMGHLMLQTLEQFATLADADPQLVKDWQATRDFLGLQEGETLASLTEERRTEAHEKFARTFEAYLMTGEAPTVGLKRAFRQFKAWLVSIYKELRSLGTEVTPEIKAVFDRMLGAEDEIAEAEALARYNRDVQATEGVELSEEDAKLYESLKEEAEAQARETLTARLMKPLARLFSKDKKTEYEKKRREYENEAREVFSKLPAYRILALLGESKKKGGLKFDRETALDIIAGLGGPQEEQNKQWFAKKGGLDPEAVAIEYGYTSASEMFLDLLTAPDLEVAVRQEAQAQLDAYFDPKVDPETVREAAERAVRSGHRLELLAIERLILAKSGGKAIRLAQAKARVQSARTAARKALEGKLWKDAGAWQRYVQAERRAAKAVERAILKGDMDEALRQKDVQILQAALATEALKAKRESARMVKFLKKFADRGRKETFGVDPRHLEQIDALLENYEFKRVSEDSLERRESLIEYIATEQELGLPISVPESLLADMRKRNYAKLTFSELEDLHNLIRAISKAGQELRALEKEGQKQKINEAQETLKKALGKHKVTHPGITSSDPNRRLMEKLADIPDSLDAALMKAQTLLMMLDGTKGMDTPGVFIETFWRPFAEAEDVKRIMLTDYAERIGNAIGKYFKPRQWGKFLNKRVFIESLGFSLTGEQMFCVYMNLGTETNKVRLMEGKKWTEAQIAEIVGKLGKDALDLGQDIRDIIETLWPLMVQLNEDLLGYAPKKEEAVPIVTPHGTYRGGYYPLAPDYGKSVDMAQAEAIADALYKTLPAYQAATRQGAYKARAKHADYQVRLDLGVLEKHLEDVVHDLAFRRATVDARRILRDKELRTEIAKRVGKSGLQVLNDWLKDTAHPPATANDFWSRGARWLRHGVTVAMLALKAMVLILQPLGWFNTAHVMGWRTARAAGMYYARPWTWHRDWRFVLEKSAFMKERNGLVDANVREVLLDKEYGKNPSRIKEFAAGVFNLADGIVTVPTWLEAYRAGLEKYGGDEEKAVGYADDIVRQTQGGSGSLDLSALQRTTSEWKRAFTMFYQYFNVVYNLLRRSGHRIEGIHNWGQFGGSLMMLVVLPAIAEGLFRDDDTPEEEDWAGWAKWVAMKSLTYGMGTVPVVRDITSYSVARVTGIGYGGSMRLTPLASPAESVVRTAKAIFDEDKDWWDKGKAITETAAYVTPYPMQVHTTAWNLIDFMRGEDLDFEWKDLYAKKYRK